MHKHFFTETVPLPLIASAPSSYVPLPPNAINVPSPEILPLSKIIPLPPTDVVAIYPPPNAATTESFLISKEPFSIRIAG